MRILTSIILALGSLVSTSAFAQGLTWSAPQTSYNASKPGGVSGRPAVGGVFFNGTVYAAETIVSSFPEVQILTNGGGTSTNFSNLTAVPGSSPFDTSNVSPALTKIGINSYLAYTDQNGFNYVLSSTDGIHWTGPSAGPDVLPAGTQDNPSITSDPSTNTVFIAYTNGQTFTPIVCKWVPGSSPSCTQYYSLRTENFNPGIAFYDGLVYLGYEDRGNDHCLYFYKYTPSTTAMTNWQPIGCNEQTSAGPSLAVHNNALYVGFATNDSNKKFTIRVSTDGNTLTFRQQPGFTMDGYPQLVDLGGSLMNIYARGGYVTTTLGQ